MNRRQPTTRKHTTKNASAIVPTRMRVYSTCAWPTRTRGRLECGRACASSLSCSRGTACIPYMYISKKCMCVGRGKRVRTE